MGIIAWAFGFIHQVDVRLYLFLNGFAGDWALDRLVAEEETNQLLKGGLFLALYWRAWFRPDPAQGQRRRRLVVAAAATLSALAAARMLATMMPFRIRPMFEQGLRHVPFAVPIQPNMEAWSSFPSDTATYFFALAIGLAYVERATGTFLIAAAATWISIPRLYIGLHYLTDILGGAVLAALIVRRAMRSEWVERRIATPIVEWAESCPGTFYALGFLLSMEMANLFDATRALMHSVVRSAWTGMRLHMAARSEAMAAAIVVALIVAYVWRRRATAAI
jgi:undecaprenyl-diphosphatase